MTALFYNVDGNALFSGIKKLPGKLELPSEFKEVKVIDTHLEINPPRLHQSCPTALPTQALYPSCMKAVHPARPLYYGVYSSFGPSYDSSYSNVNLEDGYEVADVMQADKIDYELLEHEGIDYKVLLEGLESQDLSESLFSGLVQNINPTWEFNYNAASHPTQQI
ncbi:hypothetical protein L0F63_007389, partial [Massospora cicadina]